MPQPGIETGIASHRDRLIAAIATAIEQKGFRDTTVADIVRLAHTSRRSFYEHFADRNDCFLALYAATSASNLAQVAAAVDPGLELDAQVDMAMDAFIETVYAQPALYRSFVTELPALGTVAFDLMRERIRGFVDWLVELIDDYRLAHPETGQRPLDRDIAIIIIGGLRELIVVSIREGRDIGEVRASAGEAVKAIFARVLG